MEGAGPGGPNEHTLLLLMGDHGQTLGGDHGGSSHDETHTLLLAWNLHAWWGIRQQAARVGEAPGEAEEQVEGGDAARPLPSTASAALGAVPHVAQLDFAATLAAVTGAAVPASNVGGVDSTLWGVLTQQRQGGKRGGGTGGGLPCYLHALARTAAQVGCVAWVALRELSVP